ncbi:discoidin domain-containing protein [candidate division KSB1 bacterium]|nr:discoidin domain-containing protein [candidate division KSB1 bacterium]
MKRTSFLLISFIIFITCYPLFASLDTLRIACVGNSITYGDGIGTRALDSYPYQLERLLGPGYDAENFGNSGRTMLRHGDFPLWNEVQFTNALTFKPDIVIILLGTNDSKPQNWAYKDEYIPDYIAMIDTFRTVSNPTIYACYPPPSFSDAWGIRDSIITVDIMPMIDQIIDSTGVSLIDFYTPFIGKGALFPDGIHPSTQGATVMAEIVAQTLTGAAYDIFVADVDVVRGKSANVAGGDNSSMPQNMLDGDRGTAWVCPGSPNAVVVDIGGLETIDMFQLDFGPEYAPLQPQYTIEISTDAATWTTAVDQLFRQDSTRIVCDWIDPVETRYIRLTIHGTALMAAEQTVVTDFRVLKYIDAVHAPMMTYEIEAITSRYVRYYLNVFPTAVGPEQMVIYQASGVDDPFGANTGLRQMEVLEKRYSLREEGIHKFFIMVYTNGKKVISDTLELDWSLSPVLIHNDLTVNRYDLGQNFPNPFNPVTQIPVTIESKGRVQIDIFNSTGQQVRTLCKGDLGLGRHQFFWQGDDVNGQQVASGLYFYSLKIDGQVQQTRTMMLVR